MQYDKVKITLAVLDKKSKIWGRTYFQKFMFLLNKEIFNENLLRFSYYKFGPYSSDLNECISYLVSQSIITEKEKQSKNSGNLGFVYELTTEGEKIAKIAFDELDLETRGKIEKYVKNFKDYSPTDLLRYVYLKYPESTINSIYEEE